MDRIAERKHRHELKRAVKRAFVKRQKAFAEGKIGKYGSKCVHHHGNMPVETPAPTTPAEPLAPCSVCGKLTGGCCTVAVQDAK